MKTNAFILLTILLSFFYLNSISQEIVEIKFFDANRELGGDGVIKKSTIKTDETKVNKTFEVYVPTSGDYYLSAWIRGCELKEAGGNKLITYEIVINEEKQTDKFKPEKKNWHSANYKNSVTKEDKTVNLNAGINRISFKCDAPLVPNIDFIKLSKDLSNSQISSTKFDNFIRGIQQNILIREQNPIQHKDTMLDLKNGTVLSNPSGNYGHHIGATYKYTAHGTWSLQSGDSLKITTNATNFKHVVEVVSYNYPESYTWVTTSTNGIVTLNIQIPYTDLYWIRLRSYWQDEDGLVDLTVNNVLYEDAVAAGLAGFRYEHTPSTTLNYFHANITGNSRMWIENNDSPVPGKIIGYNDDYNGSGNFNWGYAPRIKKQFSSEVGGILASAYTSATPTGTYDVYIACQNSNIYNYFANLEADDAIQSAPATGAYNCIAWAGGINTALIWPPDTGSQWYIYGQPLASFDWYFADANRYSGAISYIRSGATSSNSVIDLWAYNGNYQHASVTKPGNNQPHGYDWESKPGNLMRTFHPRNDLDGSSYGSVVEYYTTAGGLKSGMLLSESIEKGLSVMDNAEFTDEELSIIDESINLLSADLKNEFETKYDAWKETWQKPEIAMHSNPQMYAKSEEYSLILSLCKEHGKKLWPMVFDKFAKGDFFTMNAIRDLTLPKNMDIMNYIKEQNRLNSKTESGAIIVHNLQANYMKFVKELLKSLKSDESLKDAIINENVNNENDSFDFNVFPNPINSNTARISFNLFGDSRISAKLYDIHGRLVSVILDNISLKAGHYSYNIDVSDDLAGTYLLEITVDNYRKVKPLIIK